jgi:putative membrane protein
MAALVTLLSVRAAMAQTAIPPSPADFATGAAQSDQYEIVAARDALGQSHDPSVRAFAQAMIADHARSSAALGQAAAASGLAPPPLAMSSDQAAMLSALQSLRGADFDKAYARQQVLAHSQALAVAQSFATAGADRRLREAARSTAPMIRRHFDRARQISAALGPSG